MGVEVGISGSSCSSFCVALSSSLSLDGARVGALVGALVGVVLLTTDKVSPSISLALSRMSKVIFGFETTNVPTNMEMTKKAKAKREMGSAIPDSFFRGSILV